MFSKFEHTAQDWPCPICQKYAIKKCLIRMECSCEIIFRTVDEYVCHRFQMQHRLLRLDYDCLRAVISNLMDIPNWDFQNTEKLLGSRLPPSLKSSIHDYFFELMPTFEIYACKVDRSMFFTLGHYDKDLQDCHRCSIECFQSSESA